MAEDVLAEAIQHHEAGRLKKAEKLYRGVLKANPKNSVTLNLLGVLNYQAGRHSKTIQLIKKALSIWWSSRITGVRNTAARITAMKSARPSTH